MPKPVPSKLRWTCDRFLRIDGGAGGLLGSYSTGVCLSDGLGRAIAAPIGGSEGNGGKGCVVRGSRSKVTCFTGGSGGYGRSAASLRIGIVGSRFRSKLCFPYRVGESSLESVIVRKAHH